MQPWLNTIPTLNHRHKDVHTHTHTHTHTLTLGAGQRRPHPPSRRPHEASWREDEIWGWLVLSFFSITPSSPLQPPIHHFCRSLVQLWLKMNHHHKNLVTGGTSDNPLAMLWLFLPKDFWFYLLSIFLLLFVFISMAAEWSRERTS